MTGTTLTNQKTTFESNANPDIPVDGDPAADNDQIRQSVTIDFGAVDGSGKFTRRRVSATDPLPVKALLYDANGNAIVRGSRPATESIPVVIANDQDFTDTTILSPNGRGVIIGIPDFINGGTYALNGEFGSPNVHLDNTSLDVSPLVSAATTGNITGASQTVTLVNNARVVSVMVYGTYANINLTFEYSADGVTWVPISVMRIDNGSMESTSGALTNTTRAWRVGLFIGGQFRVRSTSFTSGSMSVVINPFAPFGDVTPGVWAAQSGTWSVRSQDGSGNALASATTTPGVSDRGLVARAFSYLYDSLGNALSAVIAAPAALARALVTTPGFPYDTASGSLSTAGTSLTVSSGDYEFVEVTISGTHVSANVVFEANTDWPSGGSTWVSFPGVYRQTNSTASSFSGTNIKQSLRFFMQGLPLRVRLAGITSGSVSISARLWRWSPYPITQRVVGDVNASVSGSVSTTPVGENKTFFEGSSVAFGSIGNSLTNFYNTNNKGYMVHVANTTDVELGYSFDGGMSEHFIPAGTTDSLNLMDIGGNFESGSDIQVYYPGPTPPTRGRFSFLLSYY